MCRQAAGRFTVTRVTTDLDQPFLQVGDFNGDGRTDLLATSVTSSVITFDATRQVRASSPVPTVAPAYAEAAIARLNQDARDDVVLPSGGSSLPAVNVLYATEQAHLVPASFLFQPPRTSGLHLFSLALWQADQRQFLALADRTVFRAPNLEVESAWRALFDVPMLGGEVAGPIPVGSLDERAASPCEEFVLLAPQAKLLSVYSPCLTSNSLESARIGLSSAQFAASRSAFLGDVNGDHHLDLLISDERSESVLVSYGVGDGTFHSDPNKIPSAAGDNRPSPAALHFPSRILSVGMLDGDAIADFVLTNDIVLSKASANTSPCGAPSGWSCTGSSASYGSTTGVGNSWAAAAIADFTADDHPDVVVADDSLGHRRLLLLINSGTGIFNPFVLGTQAPLGTAQSAGKTLFTVADFDGDLITDLAFAATDSAQSTAWSLSVAFGKVRAVPDQFFESVLSGEPLGLAAASSTHLNRLASDLGVVANVAGANALGIFSGRADRQLFAPLYVEYGAPASVELIAPGHYGQGGPENDLAIIAAHSGQRSLYAVPNGSAGFQTLPSNAEPALLPAAFQPSVLRSFAVDLDGDQVDELVLWGSAADRTLSVLLAKKAAQGFVFSEPVQVAGTSLEPENLQRFFPPAEQRVDLDADGRPDIFGFAAQGSSVQLVAYLNRGDGTLGRETRLAFDPLPPSLAASGVSLAPRFAWLNADADPEPELALATSAGVELFDLDFEGKKLVHRALFTGSSVPLGTHAGDFDGDGIDDLAIEGDKPELWWGEPVLP